MFRQARAVLGIGLLLSSVSGYSIELADLKDPTKPLITPKKSDSNGLFGFEFDRLQDVFTEYSVGSILIRENRKVAIVNGVQVQEGSSVEGAEVIAIDRNSVTLSINNKTQQVFMNKGSLKLVRP